ncbi:MAG: cbb3-type cytochrome oxidase assembly protein CcoS [Gallionellaceae bacterium]|nr:MAG: cbb3-type cytochrome oxidase assembly protein CcoS [Gallionellaceae bacterium]
MDVIYSLIPGMTVFGLVFVGILIWAVKHGQYEDMEGNASRILLDDDEDALLRDDAPSPPAAKKNGEKSQ